MQVAGNTFYLFASYGLTSGLGLLVTVALTRSLGSELYGDLTLAYAYVGLFSSLVEAQLGLTLIRESSRATARQMSHYLGNGLLLQAALSVVGMVTAILILPTWGYLPEIASLMRLGSLLLLLSPLALFRLIFLITQEIRLVAVLDTIVQLFSLALSLLVLLLGGSVALIILLKVVSTMLGGLLYYSYGRRLLTHPLSFRPDLQVWGLLLRRSGPLVFAGIMNAIQFHMARLLIGRYLSRSEGGLYAVAVNLLAVLTLLPNLYYTSVYPLLSRAYGENGEVFRQICRFSFKTMILLAMPLSLFAVLIGRQFVILYAVPEFAGAAPLFISLAALLFFQYSGTTLYHIILAIGAQNLLPFASLGKTLLHLVVLLTLLFPLGLGAPPLANLVSYLFVFTLYGLLHQIRPYVLMWLEEIWRPLIINLLLGLLLQRVLALSPLALAVGVPFYIALLFLAGGLRRQDVKWLADGRMRLLRREARGVLFIFL